MKAKFKFGDSVRSRAVTKQKDHNVVYPEDVVTKDAFDGVITFSFISGSNDVCYHVRDEQGNYWHRVEHELTAVDN